MRKSLGIIATVVVIGLLSAPRAEAQFFLDVESGAAFTGYNDVRIPADTGTRLSLAEDLAAEPALALRVRLGYTFAGRHTATVLMAPLTVRGSGTLESDVSYKGTTFVEGQRVDSSYRFDSYRLTYRYSFIKNEDLIVAAGLTGKIRSADIALMSGTAYAHREDLGVVPLINLWVRWDYADPFSLLVDADALWSPFGRAADVLLALQYQLAPNITARLGYRILEGGSDGGGDVYTFALFHYATAGITVSW